ncbi:MAG TPA: metal-dependent hydrolase [Saprospiraceae bacterium]|nr:metal-dependent hydrolase [Saprospiraceae bacterium]
MDSLTQMVLGAACGELVAGRKIGNKALVWGAIGGTIPDLDVLSNLFLNPLDALAFHRGPMHSLLFATIAPFGLAYLVKSLDESKASKSKWFHSLGFGLGLVSGMALTAIVCLILSFILSWTAVPFIVLIGVGFFFFAKRNYKYHFKEAGSTDNMSYWSWFFLFFISIITHPILDNFTTFGTQLFWPFTDHRFSLSNIAIVDPLYTIPFLSCVILVSLYHRENRIRFWINLFGISISSFYMIYTFGNKAKAERAFANSLQPYGVQVDRMLSTPTILNNFLWFCIGQKGNQYYCGYYSVFDKQEKLDSLIVLDHQNNLLTKYGNNKISQVLPWFSNQYYSTMQIAPDTIQYNDLRYGTFNFQFGKPEDYIFHFKLKENNGQLDLLPQNERPKQSRRDLEKFWERIKGI